MGRFFGWQAWQRVVRRPITIRLRTGLSPSSSKRVPRLRCYPHSYSASAALYCGYYEFQDMHFVADWLEPGDVFVDVGANIGVFSLVASTVDRVEVWAFEPSSISNSRARENIALNGLGDRIHLAKAAVGASGGKVSLTTGLDVMNRVVSGGGSPSGAATGVEEVDQVTLDESLPVEARERVSLIKIDVEGAESSVISGARALIEAAHPAIIVEVASSDEIRDSLDGFGYEPVRYSPIDRKLVRSRWDAPSENNLLLVHDYDAALARLGRVR